MSLIRDPAIITTAGSQMMTAGGDITYTKAALYGQDISHLTKDQLESLTSIGNPLMTVPVGISDKSVNGSATTIVLEATFQNSNLKADLPYTAVGFFAKKDDGDEKLVLVGVANPGAYLVATPPDGVATDALDIKVAIAIGDATSVTAVVDPAGSVTPATLNGAINKLDYDISAKIDAKADKTTVEGDLATKANQSDLDQTNAEVVKKADSEDVTSQLATKANSSDVAASVKSLTDSIATKADAKTVNDAISKIDFTPYAKTADVESKLQGYTNTIALTKLLDVKANVVDVYSKTELDKKLLALSTDTDGKVNVDQVSSMIADKADKADVTAELAKKDDTSDVDAKIKTVTDLANTKANSVDVTAALDKKDDTSDVDAKIKTVTDLANTKANANDVYNRSTVDNAFTEVRGRLSKLEGTQTLDSPDFNSITASGVYYITNNTPANIKNNPVVQWGVLVVSNGDGQRVSQVYYPDNGSAPWCRSLNESNWLPWYQLSTKKDVSNATNSANAASNKVDTVLTNSYFRKQGMDQNGNAVEIRANAVKQTDGGYAFDIWNTDWTASKLKGVLDQLPSKANSADVYTKTEVDSKTSGTIITYYDIVNKTPTKETNSYTNKWLVDQNVLGQFADAINSINSTRVPLVNGSGDDDLLAFKTNQIRLYPGNGKTCKNLPPASNTQWFTVQYVFENPNGDGIAIFRSPANEVWTIGNNGGIYTTGWVKLANSNDISDLQNQIQQLKDNQFEVQTFTDATAAANWEAQRPGKRMAIVNS